MNNLVKFQSNDDGEKIPNDEQVWCLVVSTSGSDAKLCSGEVFGLGEGNAVYSEKAAKRGGITCRDCLSFIRELKRVRL